MHIRPRVIATCRYCDHTAPLTETGVTAAHHGCRNTNTHPASIVSQGDLRLGRDGPAKTATLRYVLRSPFEVSILNHFDLTAINLGRDVLHAGLSLGVTFAGGAVAPHGNDWIVFAPAGSTPWWIERHVITDIVRGSLLAIPHGTEHFHCPDLSAL